MPKSETKTNKRQRPTSLLSTDNQVHKNFYLIFSVNQKCKLCNTELETD